MKSFFYDFNFFFCYFFKLKFIFWQDRLFKIERSNSMSFFEYRLRLLLKSVHAFFHHFNLKIKCSGNFFKNQRLYSKFKVEFDFFIYFDLTLRKINFFVEKLLYLRKTLCIKGAGPKIDFINCEFFWFFFFLL